VLVGYTNAGKSTLMRALTGSDAYIANKLFVTLDTTVRALHPQSVPRVLVSDTVGFISNLPHDLVASFKSTLEEAAEASLLIHVVDANDTGFERQIAVTNEVLKEIGAEEVPRLRVFNKIDAAGDSISQTAHAAQLQIAYPDCVVMSALNPADVSQLNDKILVFFQKQMIETTILLPWSEQQLRGEIFDMCKVIEEKADEKGAQLKLLGAPAMINSLTERFGVKSRKKAK
jgi:GTPase